MNILLITTGHVYEYGAHEVREYLKSQEEIFRKIEHIAKVFTRNGYDDCLSSSKYEDFDNLYDIKVYCELSLQDENRGVIDLKKYFYELIAKNYNEKAEREKLEEQKEREEDEKYQQEQAVLQEEQDRLDYERLKLKYEGK